VLDENLLQTVARAAARDGQTVDRNGRQLRPGIEGVEVRRLSPHVDHRGSLMPVLDTRDPFWAEPVVYAYEVVINPGRIKGWGMHEHQADRYMISSGDIRVALFDGREDSPTAGAIVELYFGGRNPGLLRIPTGVWHADQNWGETDARIVNFPTRAYDPEAPDKHRIDPHSGVIPFDWTLRDG
jgi:dTDP-4-dehydrorhamnose 3,5-epimerase